MRRRCGGDRRGDGGSFAIASGSTQDQKQPINRADGIDGPEPWANRSKTSCASKDWPQSCVRTSSAARIRLARAPRILGRRLPVSSQWRPKRTRTRNRKPFSGDSIASRKAQPFAAISHRSRMVSGHVKSAAGLAYAATKISPSSSIRFQGPSGPF